MEREDLVRLVKAQAELIQQLEAKLTKAEALIAALEAEIGRLRKNSSNSSKPPSSDIVKPEKAANGNGGCKKRKRGGQPGHKRHLRQPFSPSQVDRFVEITLESCPQCGGALERTGEEPEIHQQVELVEKPFIVTEYQLPQYWCEHCQAYHSGTLPVEVAKGGLFGISLIALIGYLKGRCHISYTALKDFFLAVLGINISRGFLAKQVEKASRSLKESYERLVTGLKGAGTINIDETGWKREGKKEWIWCFKTEKQAVFRVSPSRGHEVLKAVLGEEYCGIIICDFWGAYRAFKRVSSCLLQFCWAHLIREVRFLAESPDKAVSRYGRRVLEAIRLMFQTIHQMEQMEHRTWIEQMHEHRKSIVKRVAGTIPADNDAQKIAKRIQKWETGYFLFIDTGIAPTNNAGEQTIRQVVLDRKVTQGSRSEWGDEWHERFWSILTTCSLQNIPVMSFIKECITAYTSGGNYPLLLSDEA